MHIIIGDKTKEKMRLLGLKSYPFSPEELKAHFRIRIKETHPDRTEIKDDRLAAAIIQAYKELKNLAIPLNVSEDAMKAEFEKFEEQNKDMFSLWGKCTVCNGTGTRTFSSYLERGPGCKACYGSGYSLVLCPDCHGSGKFLQKRGKRVRCYRCKGKGFVPGHWPCRECGIVKKEKVLCYKCNGLGKIELKPFNPVLKKGAVLA